MAPEAIPSHVVHQVLYHLLPPTAPLPEHLLARDLLQRHHFLEIAPDNVESYFCWPSSSPSDVIRQLELLAGNVHILERVSHEIVYDDDAGSSSSHEEGASPQYRARVRIADDQDLWIQFVWQGADEPGSRGEAGWRYFDTKRMSPSESRPRATSSAIGSAPELDASTSMSPAEVSRPSSPSSDAYWDNYGVGSSSSRNSPANIFRPLAPASKEEDDEAAYWATYASVQGTADSTIPSPPSRKTPMLPESYRNDGPSGEMEGGMNAGYYRREYDDYNRPEEYPYGYEGGEADYRTDAPYGLGFDSGANDEVEGGGRVLRAFVPESRSDGDASDGSSSSHAQQLATALFPVLSQQEHRDRQAKLKEDALQALEQPTSQSLADAHSSSLFVESTTAVNSEASGDKANPGVSEAIQGIYKMWLSQQPTTSSSDTRARFLDIVSRSISSS